ncbi:hypothetical protein ZIOFF_054905 [Zingiber officinale]|uniref:Cation efflux protein cytoplasmic domain-containing protein n=1 Tax=Zingiber officinale TaxID=94328 RepID=A0A8J5KRG7_ZINOF|nr:hypothetical protein ZIOFF_054905 [Zingiber officinale]
MGFRWSNLATIRRSHRLYRHRFPRSDQPSEILSASSPSAVEKGNHLFTALRWHGAGHSHHHHHSDRKGSEGTFRLGLASDVALSVGKGLTGYLTGSTAIVADAAHSVSDIVLSGVAWWSYRAAMAPKDDDHPYGHGKFETLGALGISSMLLVTAGGIAWHSLDVLLGLLTSTPDITSFSPNVDHHNHGRGGHYHGVDLDHPVLALSMTSISIFVKEGLYWVTKRAGEKEGSELLKANAWHHRSDAVSSIVALIGVGEIFLALFLYRKCVNPIETGPKLFFLWQVDLSDAISQLANSIFDPLIVESGLISFRVEPNLHVSGSLNLLALVKNELFCFLRGKWDIELSGTILGLPFLDPAAGLLVSGMILKVGFNTGYQRLQNITGIFIFKKPHCASRSKLCSEGQPTLKLHCGTPLPWNMLICAVVMSSAPHFHGTVMLNWAPYIDALCTLTPCQPNSILDSISHHSFMELVDAAVDQSVLVPIKQTITQVEGVKGCHRLRGRRAGSFLYLDVHIEVDPFCSVSAAHDIGESVRHQIHKNHSQVAEVFIHIDPSYSYCSISEERKNLKDLEGRDSNSLSRHQEAETIISDILSKQFSKQMSLEHITLHSLQGKILVQALVSMPSEMLISEAMDIAKRAEKEILAATSSINQVSIQLRLGRPISKHHEPVVTEKETEDPQRSNCPRSNVYQFSAEALPISHVPTDLTIEVSTSSYALHKRKDLEAFARGQRLDVDTHEPREHTGRLKEFKLATKFSYSAHIYLDLSNVTVPT